MSRLSLALLVLVPLAVFATACSSYQPPKRDTSALSQRDTGTRQDCNAIMGTAFRSAEERAWFEANCSRWPAVALAVIPPAPPAGQQQPRTSTIQGDPPECAAMRGRPYSNEQERTWFLQNCIRPEQPAPSSTNNAAPQARPATAPAQPAVNANAGTCEALRRLTSPTDDQRRWYFSNCDLR